MGVFVFIIVCCVLLLIFGNGDNTLKQDTCQVRPDLWKHSWDWHKQPGTDIEYIKCKKCGKLPGQDGEH